MVDPRDRVSSLWLSFAHASWVGVPRHLCPCARVFMCLQDAKVVDSACQSLSYIAEASAAQPALLEALTGGGLVGQATQLVRGGGVRLPPQCTHHGCGATTPNAPNASSHPAPQRKPAALSMACETPIIVTHACVPCSAIPSIGTHTLYPTPTHHACMLRRSGCRTVEP